MTSVIAVSPITRKLFSGKYSGFGTPSPSAVCRTVQGSSSLPQMKMRLSVFPPKIIA